MSVLLRAWTYPGPVARAAFHARAPVVVIQGPSGSGKTGLWIARFLAYTRAQPAMPVPRGSVPGAPAAHGVRRRRLIVLKTTYRRMWENFLPSWFEWIPQHAPEMGIEWTGARGEPGLQTITMMLPDGTAAVGDVHFLAVGDIVDEDNLESFMSGLVTSDLWCNELHVFPREVYDKAIPRINRWPGAMEGGVVAPLLCGDMNAPVVLTWQHQAIVSGEWVAGVNYFRQPGGMEAGAENLAGLNGGRAYYELQMSVMKNADEINRKIHNRFGQRRDGKPVHDFDFERMASDDVEPDKGADLIVAMDAGGSPAAVIMQRLRDGSVRVIDEVVTAQGTGTARFGRALAAALEHRRYLPFHGQGRILAVGDPSAEYGADKIEGEQNWLQRVSAEIGVRVRSAPTNDPRLRRQALDDVLVVDGTKPMCVVSTRCKTLLTGLTGGYAWPMKKIGDTETYADRVPKGPYSHVVDALQYGCLMEGGLERAQGRDASARHNAVAALLAARGVDTGGGRTRLGSPSKRRGAAGRGGAVRISTR